VLGHELPAQGWAVRGHVGLVAHSPMLYGDLSARENLDYHRRLHDAPRARIDELLERVQMSARADEPVHTLSRGMVQRVAVCRAVLHDPELLLLDEPRSHLDPAAAELVAPLIGRGARRFGDGGAPRTRVVASHDVAGDLAGADFVLGLRAGAQALAAPAADVDAGALRALYA
jgi:heme exporter protein A